MAKVFEALKRAEQEQKINLLQPVPHVEKSIEPFSTARRFAEMAPTWCQELWTKLKLQSKNQNVKTILFTGTGSGNGCTTAIGMFSIYLATKMQERVLVLDLDVIKPEIGKFFRHDEPRSFFEIYSGSSLQDFDVFESLKRNLVVVSNYDQPFEEAPSWIANNEFDEFIQKARSRFDYILMDSAPVALSMQTMILSSKVDAVILMLEAERSRRRVALKIKKDLEQSGANILGTIINKRKYHIPNWLYQYL
jgi:capsular exopolysaccharide synthesis family protein